jgi:8-oxo-dGTP pyrophosphatase MutT (NUDIX family)
MGEEPLAGALREFAEEIGVDLDQHGLTVDGIHQDDHGGWSYWTVVVEVPVRFALPTLVNWETAEVAWIREDDLPPLDLHDAFRCTLVRLGLPKAASSR